MCGTQMISMAEEIFSVLIYSTKKASASAGNNSGSKYCASWERAVSLLVNWGTVTLNTWPCCEVRTVGGEL